MPVPKNNLQEVLRRRAEADLGRLASPVVASGSPASKSKFKPATATPSNTSGASVRRPNLPSFSTPGFSRPQLASKATNATPRKLICISDDSSSPRSVKRASSDLSIPPDPSPPPSKRIKKDLQAQKENVFRSMDRSYKGKAKAFSPAPATQPISNDDHDHDEPWRKMRLNHERNPHKGLKPGLQIHGSDPPRTESGPPVDIADLPRDLHTKDLDALRMLLVENLILRKLISAQELAHYCNPAKPKDLVLIQEILSLMDNRTAAIKQAITLWEAGPPSLHAASDISMDPLAETVSESTQRTLVATSTPFGSTSTTLCEASSTSSANASRDVVLPVGENSLVPYTRLQIGSCEVEEPLPGSDADYWAAVGDMSDVGEYEDQISIQEKPYSSSSGPSTSHKSSYQEEIYQKLRIVFGLQSFRHNQLEAIEATLSGSDVFVLMPTGGGKSLCYQLPAVCKGGKTKGVTVVVSPLVALMKDQVQALQKKKVDVYLWNAESSWDEARFRLRAARKPDLLYITPEKLKESNTAQIILDELYRNNELARFVIDEAHCISTWGQDFREAYRALDTLRQRYPSVPIMALTATATRVAVDDIVQRLGLRDKFAFLKQSFNRPNLNYMIQPKSPKWFDSMKEFILNKHPQKSGIVYCLGRERCECVAKQLNEHGFRARHFHAGLTTAEKDEALFGWQTGKVHIIVATIAFGMGIDKPDVRFVIHHSLPKSLEGYYQETGRAGRDGKPADCVLYFHFRDFYAVKAMIERPDRDNVLPSQESIERQIAAAGVVVDYCTNTSDCRRVQLLQHFDERFDKAKCSKMCDNCSNPNPLISRNVTQEAHDAVELMQSFAKRNEMVTIAQCRDVLRGAKNKFVREKQYDQEGLHGCARELAPELVEQLLQRLCRIDVLKLERFQQANGFHTEYLALGPASKGFLQKKQDFCLQWRPRTTEPRGIKKLKSHSERPAKQVKQKSAITFDPGDEEPYDFSDDSEEIVNDGQPQITMNQEKQQSSADCDPARELYRKMCLLRRELMIPAAISEPEDILDNSTLQCLSAMCPQDYTCFKSILKDLAQDTMSDLDAATYAEEKFELYGAKFLSLCVETRCRQGTEELHSRFAFQNPSMPSTSSVTIPKYRFKPHQ